MTSLRNVESPAPLIYFDESQVALGKVSGADVELARKCAEAAYAWFPGHPWSVSCRHECGMIYLRHLCTPEGEGFLIKIRDLDGDPALLTVKRAAGEILERFNVPRSALREDDRNW